MQLKEQYNKVRQEAARKEHERDALTSRREALATEVAQAMPCVTRTLALPRVSVCIEDSLRW